MNVTRGHTNVVKSVQTPMGPTTVPVDLAIDYLLMATLASVS